MTSMSDEELAQQLENAYQILRENYADVEELVVLEQAHKKIVGISSRLRTRDQLVPIKNKLIELTGLDNQARILQVIGDSGSAFTHESVAHALKLMDVKFRGDTMLLFGFTGRQSDTNWLVSIFMSQNPERISQVVANTVNQSVDVIGTDGWTASNLVQNLILLYRPDRLDTKFGDDTWLSDDLMTSGRHDEILCFEGGLQSLEQCLNGLEKGIAVTVVTHMRAASANARFSAAGLLVAVARVHDDTLALATIDMHFTTYLEIHTERSTALRTRLRNLVVATPSFRKLIKDHSLSGAIL